MGFTCKDGNGKREADVSTLETAATFETSKNDQKHERF